jgi:two-component system, NarL family, nitrate/nitrite response regulator NarL
MERIRVGIVDDHPLYRDGVVQTLRSAPDFEVVGEGGTADEAIRLVETRDPDVLLLDLTMPGDGLDAITTIVEQAPSVKILVLTASEHDDDLLTALDRGARGYALKGLGRDDLRGIVRAVAGGERYVPPSLAAGLLIGAVRSAQAAPAEPSPVDRLSEREQQVLDLLADGRSNREIGDQLHLTEKTVKHYVTSILQKLDVRNRTQAALL